MSLAAPQRSHALDTLRALAIVSVLSFHLFYYLPSFMQPLAAFGWMGR